MTQEKWIRAVAQAELDCVECGIRATAFWKDEPVCSAHFVKANLIYQAEGYTGSDIPDVHRLLHRGTWVKWLWRAEGIVFTLAALLWLWWKLTH